MLILLTGLFSLCYLYLFKVASFNIYVGFGAEKMCYNRSLSWGILTVLTATSSTEAGIAKQWYEKTLSRSLKIIFTHLFCSEILWKLIQVYSFTFLLTVKRYRHYSGTRWKLDVIMLLFYSPCTIHCITPIMIQKADSQSLLIWILCPNLSVGWASLSLNLGLIIFSQVREKISSRMCRDKKINK